MKAVPKHISGLLAYLSQPNEKANEDLALGYFRHAFGDEFTRQSQAKGADGYVPGHFVLELKGNTSDWQSGFFQALAYKTVGLDFGVVVVAAKGFLAAWNVDDLPDYIWRSVVDATGSAPNGIGKRLAREYRDKAKTLLKLATWYRPEAFDELFAHSTSNILKNINEFESAVKAGVRKRLPVTPGNFPQILGEMKPLFSAQQPLRAVRAFYTMIHGWKRGSTVELSKKHSDQVTFEGEVVTDLLPEKRLVFKELAERHYVPEEYDIDEFFVRYDAAIDAVDPDFRKANGIFFTDPLLSRFALWFAQSKLGDIGKNYLVVDPACGSGNLVTSWRTPLELRHKVVSEIEPEMLFAVERRMRRDSWHASKFTVVPKVASEKGLNFLSNSAEEYLEILSAHLHEKGHHAKRPIAFLCNPPYRNNDDQSVVASGYEVHPSLVEMIGQDAVNERYCPFLAQMKRICEVAEDSGLPENSLLLVFTKSAWLTRRQMFSPIRREILGSFQDEGGFIVNAKEFFDVKGSFPIAFSIWRYKGKNAELDTDRTPELLDLTWMKRANLSAVKWEDSTQLSRQCNAHLKDKRAIPVAFGGERQSIHVWTGQSRTAFQRLKRKAEEADANFLCGLPYGDERHERKWTLGENTGSHIGFMDDLTPCRITKNAENRPWFRLNSQFMDCRKTRCFSGPADQKSYSPTTPDEAKKIFFWFGLGRTLAQCGYPMWTDAEAMWGADLSGSAGDLITALSFAIGYADNECVEVTFPGGNPVKKAPEICCANPMSPLDVNSYWNKQIRPHLGTSSLVASRLVKAVDKVFEAWKEFLGKNLEVDCDFNKPYFVGARRLSKAAGLLQIRDFAWDTANETLVGAWDAMQTVLKSAKDEFHRVLTDPAMLNYYGAKGKSSPVLLFVPRTKFDRVLEKRLTVASCLVNELHGEVTFGRTKLAKLVYLVDAMGGVDLEMTYARQAAGPLDGRAFYNEKMGLEALAKRHGYFAARAAATMVSYEPGPNLKAAAARSAEILGDGAKVLNDVIQTFRKLDTAQCEIVATLYACWNDLILDGKAEDNQTIVSEFLKNWHPKKARFAKGRVMSALKWMQEHGVVPRGLRRHTVAVSKD